MDYKHIKKNMVGKTPEDRAQDNGDVVELATAQTPSPNTELSAAQQDWDSRTEQQRDEYTQKLKMLAESHVKRIWNQLSDAEKKTINPDGSIETPTLALNQPDLEWLVLTEAERTTLTECRDWLEGELLNFESTFGTERSEQMKDRWRKVIQDIDSQLKEVNPFLNFEAFVSHLITLL